MLEAGLCTDKGVQWLFVYVSFVCFGCCFCFVRLFFVGLLFVGLLVCWFVGLLVCLLACLLACLLVWMGIPLLVL